MELSMDTKEFLTKVYDKDSESLKFIRKDRTYSKELLTIEETLSKFGLLKNEIKIYLFLARSGEKKAGEIAEAISLHRTETYRILHELEKKGILYSVFEKPIKFTAVPLDKAIDVLVNAQKIKINLLEKEKENLVELWLSMPQVKTENKKKELFQMLEGEQQMLLKAHELLERTQETFQVFAPDEYLAQLFYSDFTDELKDHKDKINIEILTGKSPKSVFFMKQMLLSKLKCRTVEVQNLPCFMISDKKELLIAFHENDFSEDQDKKKFKTVAIWTNYSAFVLTLQVLFSKLIWEPRQ